MFFFNLDYFFFLNLIFGLSCCGLDFLLFFNVFVFLELVVVFEGLVCVFVFKKMWFELICVMMWLLFSCDLMCMSCLLILVIFLCEVFRMILMFCCMLDFWVDSFWLLDLLLGLRFGWRWGVWVEDVGLDFEMGVWIGILKGFKFRILLVE